MTVFMTCRSCAKRGQCEIQDGLRAAIKGHWVTSLRHTCREHRLSYHKGQAVWAYVQSEPRQYDKFGDEIHGPSDVPKAWFPGHFIEVSSRSNTRGLVFIETGAGARGDTLEFLPIHDTEEGAVCKLVWDRIEARDAPPVTSCPHCGQLAGMKCEGPEILADGQYGRPCKR